MPKRSLLHENGLSLPGPRWFLPNLSSGVPLYPYYTIIGYVVVPHQFDMQNGCFSALIRHVDPNG